MDIGILGLSVIVSTGIDDKSVVGVNIPRFIHGVISTAQTPRIASSTAARPSRTIITVTMILLLGIRSRWEGELHQMGDALLTASSVGILHAERLEILILIQGSELFARLVLGFGCLLVARGRGGGRGGVGSTRRRGRIVVVVEELLRCLRDRGQSGADGGLRGFGAVDLTRQRQRTGIRHGGVTASEGVVGGGGRRGGGRWAEWRAEWGW